MPFAPNQPARELRREEARQEISGHIVGPMPPREFFSKFLPTKKLGKSKNTAPIQPRIFEKMSQVSNELEMYTKWIKALEPYCGGRIVQVDSHSQNTFDQDGHPFGPDITTYFDVPAKDRKEKCTLTQADMLLEFKYSSSDDPFDDNGDSFERQTKGAKETLGQITVYATAQLARQFRTHIFSILVFPKYARLLRWDRSGVIVTGKIDLLSTDWIPNFFLRLERAPPELRGVDTTVRPAKLGKRTKEVRDALNASKEAVFLEIDVNGETFIIADLVFFGASSPFGRATRCFRAYHLETKTCHILKDSWRNLTPSRRPEHLIYKKLEEKKVKHIPKMKMGRDIDESGKTHQTITQDYVDKTWSKASYRLRTFRHYRIVLEELGGHLADCHNIRDVVTAIRDAAEAEAEAAQEAAVDHRDVSYANIMIKYDETGVVHGYLIDWDMCVESDVKYTKEDSSPERTGTWYFIAARLILQDAKPQPQQDRTDDVESLFHVLLYMAVHFTDHGLDLTTDLRDFVTDYFHKVDIQPDGRSTGGKKKARFFRDRGDDILNCIKNAQLRTIIKDLIPPLGARYDVQPVHETKDTAGKRVVVRGDFPPDHDSLLKTLEDPKWFVDILDGHLKEKTDWEEHAELVPQRILPPLQMRETKESSLAASALRHRSRSLAKLKKEREAQQTQAKKRKAAEQEPEEVPVKVKPKTRGEPVKKRRRT
ncbi:hypothetical protein BDN72DRAFT_156273 [Pluteus cervinus]|uniref:Uncharacterized protein n=1 Tax=Pluteus cervinus TaxID=181527 RepID=A0ACD3ALB8_9AGAR|nr:hypothetical protein BDN72DRAFT_156273 [Pluteus cervinus]